MCEECESGESLALTYAQKRARMRQYWMPKRKASGFNAAETTTTNDPQSQAETPKRA